MARIRPQTNTPAPAAGPFGAPAGQLKPVPNTPAPAAAPAQPAPAAAEEAAAKRARKSARDRAAIQLGRALKTTERLSHAFKGWGEQFAPVIEGLKASNTSLKAAMDAVQALPGDFKPARVAGGGGGERQAALLAVGQVVHLRDKRLGAYSGLIDEAGIELKVTGVYGNGKRILVALPNGKEVMMSRGDLKVAREIEDEDDGDEEGVED